jgi:uncharacterized phage protein (TIGR02216 family)
MTTIDWPGLMRAGLHGLGLSPQEFWRLTPAELRMMLGAEASAPPLTRARLEELAAAFPDHATLRGSGSTKGTGIDRDE